MRQISRKAWLLMVAVAIALLSELAVLLNSIATGAIVSSWPVLVAAFIVTASIPILLFLQERLKSTPETLAAAQENRQSMLNRVQNTWITGFLENPHYYSYAEQLLPLPLRERVGSRFDRVLTNPMEPTQTIPSGTTITQVFDQAGGELHILGEPGAGKTTLLLELARDLLERAQDNEAAPMPVVLMLSSWATRKLPLEQWIAEELQAKYDVPTQIGKEWVKANQLLLLLDGLDEVAPGVLPACIDAINEYYRQAHRSLVVCCRTEEFLKQAERLALHRAVIVQPLSSEQVDSYLEGLAAKREDVEGLKHTLHQNTALSALATTPLFLTVLILSYHGKPMKELLELVKTTPTDQPHLLFQNYVEQMLQRKGTRIHASKEDTKHWLGWLAGKMTAHQQSELYLEQFQPDWLPKRQRAFYRWSMVLFYGLVGGLVGGLFVGLLGRLAGELVFGLLFGLFVGLLYGLVGGLFVGLLYGPNQKIEPVEALTWSLKGLRFVLFVGLLFGLFVGLLYGLLYGLLVGLFVGLLGGLLFGLFVGLRYGSSRKQLTERSKLSPNEGIRRSVKYGLVFGPLFGLLGGLLFGLLGRLAGELFYGLLGGLLGGLLFGLIGGLYFGLGATVQHYTLRFWLWRKHLFPWQAVSFLDDAVEQLLLRKVGGGYIFRHRLLQDYFASLDTPPPKEALTASASLQKPDENE